jgi:hypothetical protein
MIVCVHDELQNGTWFSRATVREINEGRASVAQYEYLRESLFATVARVVDREEWDNPLEMQDVSAVRSLCQTARLSLLARGGADPLPELDLEELPIEARRLYTTERWTALTNEERDRVLVTCPRCTRRWKRFQATAAAAAVRSTTTPPLVESK